MGIWILLFLAGTALYAWNHFQAECDRQVAVLGQVNERLTAEVAAELDLRLSGNTADLEVLAGLASLQDYLNRPNEVNRQSLERDFVNFALAKRHYAQIRIIDVAGDEVVRIDFSDGRASVATASQLQAKGHRDYVIEGLLLRPGEVYVSPLDLNVEHGIIEDPPSPMLRFAASVSDSAGKPAGLLVLNYDAADLVNWILESFSDSTHRFLLVNDIGAFVLAPDPARNWAFLYPDTDRLDRFDGRFPQASTALGLRDAVAVQSDEGLFHIRVFAYPSAAFRAGQPMRTWLLVGWTPQAVVDEQSVALFGSVTLMWAIVGVIGVLSILLLGVLYESVVMHRVADWESRQRLLSVFESAADGIVMIDGKGQVEFCNEAVGRMFDWPTEDIIGHNISRLMPETHAAKHDDYLECYQRTGNQFVLGATREMQGRRRDGSHFPMELSVSEAWIGDRRVFTGFLRDISLRKQIEVRIHHQAVHDDLTGLPNRRMLLTELDSIIQRARDGRYIGILAVVDLDHFMMLNDVMGHLVGDKVLRSIASRLDDRARAGDLVARLDGDEFAIVVDNLGQDDEQAIALATRLVEEIQDTIREPLSISDGIYTLTGSIGIAVYPRGNQEPQDLLKQADIAKNRAKKTGRDTVRFYRKSMEIESQRRMLVVQELRRGLANKEFVLHYQPKVDVFSDRIAGLEALIRWQHPVRGLLLPDEFIGHAEENGLVSELGWWTLSQALEDIRDLDMKGLAATVPHIAINVSPVHFYARDFLSRLVKLVNSAGLAANRVELEITENLLLDNIDLAVTKMQSLRETGISIALDDFGTGYSSLSYLQKLPVDRIKIDRSFVRHVDKQSDQAAMVRAMLSLAKVKPVRFVAEGVETQGEFAWLRDHGCQDVQGFFFCRPLPMEELTAFARHFQAGSSRGVGGAA